MNSSAGQREMRRQADKAMEYRCIIYCKEGSDHYYFHYNHKGDVISITDTDKEEVAYYEYDACLPACAPRCSECGRVGPARMAQAKLSGQGDNAVTEAGSWSSPYRFSTKEWDDDSGLYYFGARYYSPEIGRWTQRDPAGTVDGLNLYGYLSNEPTRHVDWWGLQEVGIPTPDLIYIPEQDIYFDVEKILRVRVYAHYIRHRNLFYEVARWWDKIKGPAILPNYVKCVSCWCEAVEQQRMLIPYGNPDEIRVLLPKKWPATPWVHFGTKSMWMNKSEKNGFTKKKCMEDCGRWYRSANKTRVHGPVFKGEPEAIYTPDFYSDIVLGEDYEGLK